ncbi:cytochrome P450 306a1 isoform X2 [Chelonus insularis]|uniref:cytochrome P450 306a1 isoform X2 n=1 Tax=Chelonus insularis TaxID=460826 RepID=UPI00158BA03E|nr:cytochrome P450 306a1 isoform X2 [Chelonus insularis]
MFIVYSSVIIIILTLIMGKLIKKGTQKLPPGPRGLPIVGYLPWIDSKTPHKSLTQLTEKYGPICGLWMGSVYTVLLSDPKLIRQTLSRDEFAGRAPLYVTHGIICSEGELWKEQRKFVVATIKSLGVMKYGTKRDELELKITNFVNEAIKMIEERSDDNGIEPFDILHHCVGNIMNDLVFGKVYNESDETWKWLRHLQEEGVKHIGVAGPFNFLPFLRYFVKFKKTMSSLIDGKMKTHQLYKKLIEEYEEKQEMNYKNSDNFLAAFNVEMKNRILNNCQLGSFTEQQYYHLLADLFGAGTDTTLTTIRWFLLYMAIFPENQENIYQRIKVATNNNRELVALKHREFLTLLEAAICEVQRLRSVVPVGIPHGAMANGKIEDYDIPKGTMIIPLQWAVHMNSTYWKNPEKFDPYRFITSDGSLLKSLAFMPFQTGKRICVGDELARMMLFLFAARILQKFHISIAPGENIDMDGICGITLVPKNHRFNFLSRNTN